MIKPKKARQHSTGPDRVRPRRSGRADLTDQYQSKAITRALDAVECFVDESSQFSLTELAKKINIPASSLFRSLAALEARGYITHTADGIYRATRRHLYGAVREQVDKIVEIIRPFLHRLASDFNETASLAYLFENRIQVLDTVNAFHSVRLINTPGRVIPPHCTSLGKALTAFQPQPLMNDILEVHGLYARTPRSLTDRRQIVTELELVRKRGFAFDRGESCEDGICIGVPIRLKDGRVNSAISVSSISSRMTAEREKEILESLMLTASDIATRLIGIAAA